MKILKSSKKIVGIFLLSILLIPHLTWAEQQKGYNFTNLDLPDTPPAQDDGYTDELWEVTDSGVYDNQGNKLSSAQASVLDANQAPEQTSGNPSAESSKATGQQALDEYQKTILNNYGNQKAAAENRLNSIQQSLEAQKKRFQAMTKRIEEAEDQLTPVHEEMKSLKEQIELINKQIRTTKDKITNVEVMIAEKKIQIKEALLALEKNRVELEVQKEVVLDYVRLLYDQESQFFDLYDESTSTLKLLLSDNTVSENLLGQEYFEVMEEVGRSVFHDLDAARNQLKEKQQAILEQQADLEFLYGQLENEKQSYEESRLSKKTLLEQTQGKEEEYQLLLEEAQQQQLEAAIAVKNLQDNLTLIAGKLKTLDDTDYQVEAVIDGADELALEKASASGKPFIWPVPANKITAEFHDPSYPAKWGYHNAIDIRAKQYTEIRAPANGYVFKAKDNGMGYSYIVLAHKDNLVTVFGHVSDIRVKTGQVVKQGELIGLSGGTPGTKGAGLQTTGAHLHFEVHQNGTPVDPLPFLPLEELPLEYVPDKYLPEINKLQQMAEEDAAANDQEQADNE